MLRFVPALFLLPALGVMASADEPPIGPAPKIIRASIVKDSLIVPQEVPVTKIVQREVEVIVDGRKEKRIVQEAITVMEVRMEARELKGVRFLDLAGKEVDLATARKRLAKPTLVLHAFDGRPVHPAYQRILDKGLLVVAMPLAPAGPDKPPLPKKIPDDK